MPLLKQINEYIANQPEAKRIDMLTIHDCILRRISDCKLWFLDGKDENGKIISNPNIGYGQQIIKYANGKSREFYRVGLSSNKTGISIYILGLNDKNYLSDNFGKKIGKASITGYCIKFKTLKDIDSNILEEAIIKGLENQV